jgi:diguanylate cyclase (GGDEF)-like protein
MEKDIKKTVLLIDPDISVTKILSERLRSIGFNTLSANDDVTAFKLIQTGSPDIILLDILMKMKNGNDILTAIKSHHNSQNIPVIILSSAVDVNSKVNGFLSGASDYIVKPFRFAEVLARINNQIRILNMQHELEKKNKELTEKNMLLQQMAVTDGLTGLYNKRYILSRLSSEISHAVRYREPISFLMVDVDHFKQINDTYGHVVGDILLKEVAQLLRKLVREFDIIARYGGEEFLIVLPNGDIMGAKILAERLRDSIEKSVFNINGEKISITISIGIRNADIKLNFDSGSEVTKLINQADIALYNAKANGRNRVEVYIEDMDTVEKDVKGDNPILDKEIHISERFTH